MPIEKLNLESSARLILDSAMARFLPKDIDQVPTTIRRIIQGFEVVANYDVDGVMIGHAFEDAGHGGMRLDHRQNGPGNIDVVEFGERKNIGIPRRIDVAC